MITFAYRARDAKGKNVSGVTEANDEDAALGMLMSRGLMVLDIEQRSFKKQSTGSNKTVPDVDLVLFTRQLATMIDAGLPLVTALNALYEQTDPKKQAALRYVLGDVMSRVQQGDTFHEALAKHPKAFSRLFLAMVKAGETGGMISEILDRLAGFLEASARLAKKVKSALSYPVIVISIALGVTAFLIIKVVPVFGNIFADFGAKLPAPTQFLIDLSNAIRSSWYWIIIMIGGVFFGIKSFLDTRFGTEFWHRYQLTLPVVGPLSHKICMSRFARTFAQLIRAGVPILDVMAIVGETSGNTMVEKAIKNVAVDVEKGENFTVSMAKQTVFPPMMLRMVSAGEATGQIDNMLEKMADFWDEEIETMLDGLTSLIEPFLIVFLGVVVGGIVIAMFLPIFKLNEIVSGNK